MKKTTLCSLFLAASFSFSAVAFAGSAKTYQVTGPVLEMNDSMIVVQKGKIVGRSRGIQHHTSGGS